MNKIIAFFYCFLVCQISLTPILFAQTERTSLNGPSGGKITAIQTDPVNPDILFAGTAGGVFQSFDRGQNWHHKNTGLGNHHVNCLVFDSTEQTALFCGMAKGLYRSFNFGDNWEFVGLDSLKINMISCHSQQSNIIFLATDKGVYKSEDNGDNWLLLSGVPHQFIYCILLHANETNTVLIGTDAGVYRSYNSGGNWDAWGLDDRIVQTLSMHPESNRTLYAGTQSGGVFRNQSGDKTWDSINNNLPARNITALVNDATKSGTIYAASQDAGIFRTLNRGDRWENVSREIPYQHINSFHIQPSDPENLFAGTENSFFQSLDGGEHWQENITGMVASQINCLAINPQNTLTFFAGTSGDILQTTDRGLTWWKHKADLIDYEITTIVISPFDTSRIWAGTQANGMYLSQDAGKSWTRQHSDPKISQIVPDPNDAQIVYFVSESGIWKSNDAGVSWNEKNVGIPGSEVSSLAINPANPLEIFAGARESGVYRSTNQAERWYPVINGLDNQNVFSLMIQSVDDQLTIFAGTTSGIYQSKNQGSNWYFSGLETQKIIQIESEAAPSPHIYAVSAEGDLFNSPDRGENWEPLEPEIVDCKTLSITTDPVAAGVVYAGTEGKGIYRIQSMSPKIVIDNSDLDFQQVKLDSTAKLPVVISNSGAATLQILAVTSTDPAFGIEKYPRQIEAAAGDTMFINFQPTEARSYQADIKIHSNDPDSPYSTIQAQGEGVWPGLTVSPEQLSFGDVRTQQNAAKMLTLTNSGSAPLNISSIYSQTPYFTSAQKTVALAPGESFQLEMTFSPVDTGYQPDSLFIKSAEVSQVVFLEGRGIQPNLELSHESHNFGELMLGDSLSWQFQILNTGNAPLLIKNMRVHDPATFQILNSANSVEAASALTVTVIFHPLLPATFNDNIIIETDAGNAQVSLTGRAVKPRLELSAVQHDFGSIPVGERSSTHKFTLYNPANLPVQLHQIHLGVSDGFQFEKPEMNINPHDSLDIAVRFSPRLARFYQDTLFIRTEFQDTLITLIGEGIAPQIVLSDSVLAFGEVNVGEIQQKSLSIENQGNDTLHIFQLSNQLSQFFLNEEPLQIAPQARRTLSISFKPTSNIFYQDTLRLVTSSGPAGVVLHGKGRLEPLQTSAQKLDFAPLRVGKTSTSQALFLYNQNLIKIPINQFKVNQPEIFQISANDSIISEKDSVKFQILFSPQEKRHYRDSLLIRTSFGDIKIGLSGEGIAPLLTVSDSVLNFGEVDAGKMIQRRILIFNSGNDTLHIADLENAKPAFSIHQFPRTLVPNSSVAIQVEFSPLTEQSYRDTVRIRTDAGQAKIILQGTGIVHRIGVSDSVFNFGDLRAFTKTFQTLYFYNRGIQDLNLNTVKMTCGQAFEIAPSQAVIHPQDSLKAILTVFPEAAEFYADTIQVHYENDYELLIPVSVHGFINSEGPVLLLSPDSLKFGQTRLNETVVSTVKLTNGGNGQLQFIPPATGNSVFQIPSFPTVLDSGQAILVQILFKPNQRRQYLDSLIVRTNANQQKLFLHGTGVAPKIVIADSNLLFESTAIDSARRLTFDIKNAGNDTLYISSLTVSPREFNITPTQAALGVGDSLAVQVTFHPSNSGIFNGALKIKCNDPERPETTISLAGTSGEGPVLLLSPDSLQFGIVKINETVVKTVKLMNDGDGQLLLKPLSTENSAFNIPSFPDVIDSGQTILVQILFEPNQRREYLDSLVVQTNANQQKLFLLGTGVAPRLVFNDSSYLFENTAADSSRHLALAIKNSGNDTLIISSLLASPREFSITPTRATLQPEASLTAKITFHPFSTGRFTGTLQITSNDPERPVTTISLMGTSTEKDLQGPVIIHLPLNSYPINQPVVISVQCEDEISGVQSCLLFYRNGGQRDFLPGIDISPGSATIPAQYATTRGIEYYFQARDAQGNQTRLPANSVFYISIISDAAGEFQRDSNGRPVPQPAGGAETGYRLISIPLILENPAPMDVLGDELGLYDESRWVFAEYNPLQGDGNGYVYLEQENIISDFKPGRAFWLLVKDPEVVIKSGKGQSVSTAAPFFIHLTPGWNLIGNPFNFPIPLNQIQLKSAQPVQPFGYQGQWDTVQVVQPWQGYAIYNFSSENDSLVILPNPDFIESAALVRSQREKTATGGWQIKVEAACRRARDTHNWFGTVSTAKVNRDDLDQPEPPGIGEFVSLYFTHPEWETSIQNFTTDFRPASQAENCWEFEVQTNISSAEVKLAFKVPQNFPVDDDILIIDWVTRTTQRVSENPVYKFPVFEPTEPRRFKMIAGSRAFIEAEKSNLLPQPKSFELKLCYPNPLKQGTHIQYAVPKPGPISLTVYNIQGQQIKTLVLDKFHQPGFYHQIWDGRNRSGNLVANGIYFYRMKSPEFQLARKVMVLR